MNGKPTISLCVLGLVVGALSQATLAVDITPDNVRPDVYEPKPSDPPPPPSSQPPPSADSNTEQPAEQKSADNSGITISLIPRFGYEFPADLKDSGGSSSIWRTGLRAKFAGPVGDRARWNVDVDTEVSWYNWKDVESLLPSGRQPLSDTYQIRLFPGLAYSLDRQWTLIGGGIVEIAGERDADIGDSTTYGGYAEVGYTFGENLSLMLGGAFKTRLENSGSFYPLIGVNWKINDKVSVQSEGLGGRVVAKATDRLDFSILARYDRREFRLEDDGAIPSGVVRDIRAYVGAGLDWRVCDQFTLGVQGGAVVYQRYFFDNQSGNRVASDRTRPAPFVGITGTIRF